MASQQPLASKEAIYLTLQSNNTNELTSASVSGAVNLSVNAIVTDMSEYDIYVNSMTISTANIPYFNAFRNIWNFNNNAMVYSISISSTAVGFDGTQGFYNSDGAVNGNLLYGATGLIANDYGQTGTCFLQYRTESTSTGSNPPSPATYTGNPITNIFGRVFPNGGSSIGNQRAYWDCHSIQQFVDFVNQSLLNICSQANPASILNPDVGLVNVPYFVYDSFTQLYSLVTTQAFNDAYVISMNGQLERIFDAFRFTYISETVIVPSPPNVATSPWPPIQYEGIGSTIKMPLRMDYVDGVFTYYAEYTNIINIIDIHSIVILSGAGSDWVNVNPSYVPVPQQQDRPASQLPTLPALLTFGLDFNGINSQVNNAYIQYRAPTVLTGKKLTVKAKTNLRNLSLVPYVMTIENDLYPINIPCNGGLFQIELVLYKK